MTQDQAAQLLRRFGLEVSRSALAALERGSGRTLDVGELALVCLAFKVPLDYLLTGSERVRISESATVAAGALAAMIAGEVADVDVPATRETVDVEGLAAVKRRHRRLWPTATPAGIVRAERLARGDVETKAAQRIDVDPADLSIAAFGRFGRSFTDERDARLGEVADTSKRSLQALRGHITRQVLAELEPVLTKGRS
jgi:transcriptional regulator with XRE-family HTH domain